MSFQSPDQGCTLVSFEYPGSCNDEPVNKTTETQQKQQPTHNKEHKGKV